MFVTNPSYEAMRLVMHEFAVLKKKLEDEIKQGRAQGLFNDDEVLIIRDHVLKMARMLELTHLSRTAPVSGYPRLDWRRERFLQSLPDEERYELEYTDPEFTLKDGYDDEESWREVAGWLLGNIVSPGLSTAFMALTFSASRREKLDSIDGDMEGSDHFYDPDGDSCSWFKLIEAMTWHHMCLIQRRDGLDATPFLITSADYDTINASFDAVPEYNYAAKIAGTSIHASTEATDAKTTRDPDGEPNSNGYVRNPPDGSAFVSKSEILSKHTPTTLRVSDKRLTEILANYAVNKVRWTRPISGTTGKPHPQRLSIHLTDWVQFVDRATKSVDTDEDGECEISPTPAEIEQRMAEIRSSKAGK
ncbi:MAG: hypothetical protein O2945_22405 [Planctomycetota bacterium]|nr:hypothetical protein [Planctomycetota bacterium]MDA0921828.1 hypothetical protein [Planctomycetota bacterium]